jgi:hypothetical protein
MSVTAVLVMQVAHRKKENVEKFIKSFQARRHFRGVCRDYSPLSGSEPKIVKRSRVWYMATVAFVATNWDNDSLSRHFDESYVIQVGPIDDREAFSTALDCEDDDEVEKRLAAFDCSFDG